MLIFLIQRFTKRHWEDLAEVLFSFIIVPTTFCSDNIRGDCTDMGACSDSITGTYCHYCTLFTNRIGGLIGMNLDETVGEN